MGKLNDKATAAAQPKEKQYKLSDGDGLSLIVQPNGKKLWWFRYRFAGKEKTLSIGIYPVVGLKNAREWALEARKLVAAGLGSHEGEERYSKRRYRICRRAYRSIGNGRTNQPGMV